MARIHRLTTSRVEHKCHGGHIIPAGEGYSWAAPGFRSRKKFACSQHPFRESDLTSGVRSEAEAAREAFEDAIAEIDFTDTEALEQLETSLEDLKGSIEEYVSTREEAFEAWEHGNSQLEDLLEIARAAYDELEGAYIEEWDGDEELRDADLPEEPTAPDSQDFDDDDALEEAIEAYTTAHEEWEEKVEEIENAKAEWAEHVSSQIDEVSGIVGGLEF